MHDLCILLDDTPGSLARMGEVLGQAGISVEGGGAWVADGKGHAHFLFADGEHARRVLEQAGIRVTAVHEVLIRRLKQDQPGQLGAISRAIAMAGASIEVMYSDHANRLILVVDDMAAASAATLAWTD
ncbi:MAG TPA: amino acid-binding ACT domain-containing protein [Gammaproteobacteria bacterium]|nr:amino acid-binding ACT domain-containing protein [Gammaproteobacteria bacterium]